MWRALLVRVRALFRRSAVERDLDEELRYHLERETQRNISHGMSPDDAARAARRGFGNVDVLKEESRDARGTRVVENLAADVRYGARVLRRSPVFTITATLTLALGLGLNIAVFAVADGLLFRPMPYGNPDRLALLVAPNPPGGGVPWVPGAAVIAAEGSRTMASVAGATEEGTIEPLDPDEAPWTYYEATEDVLDVLQVRPILGRPFQPGEGDRRPVRAGLLSYGAWQRRFGGNRDVIGRVIRFRDFRTLPPPGVEQSLEIVGVLPDRFVLPYFSVNPGFDVVIADRPFVRDAKPAFVYNFPVVRLRDGATLQQAQAELDVALASYWQTVPPASRARVQPTTLHEGLFVKWRPTVIALLAAGSLVFALATINMANLILARGLRRQREIALRATIGASFRRVAQQLAVESALLGLAASIAAGLLCVWSYPILAALLPSALALMLPPTLDPRVLVVLAGLTCLTNVLFAIVAARQSVRIDLRSTMGQARTGSVAVAPAWGRSLVAAEVAMATLLLVGASLVVVSFERMAALPLGFDDRNLYAATSRPPDDATARPADTFLMQAQVLDALRRNHPDQRYEAADCAPVNLACRTDALAEVTPGYFDLLRTPVIRGRMFTGDEERAHARLAVMSQHAAAQRFPGQDPIGQRVSAKDGAVFEVIGVTADTRARRDTYPAQRTYVPWGTLQRGPMMVLTRTTNGADALSKAVAAEVRPRLPEARVTVTPLNDRALITPLMLTTLFGSFGVVALVVAAVGVFGIQAVVVAGRRMEIAVRVALGGHPRAVTRLIVGQALVPVVAGLAIGLVGAWWAGSSLRPLLYETTPRDLGAWVSAAAILFGVAAVSAWLPARRASRADPLPVLKSE